jgi:hypothetical protein
LSAAAPQVEIGKPRLPYVSFPMDGTMTIHHFLLFISDYYRGCASKLAK